MEYVLVIHRADEGGCWADVPALDGCFAQGEALEEVLAEGRAAIASHLEALRADGRPVPSESGIVIATVAVPQPSTV